MRYNYYWYHYGLSMTVRECIEDAIMDKDYELFMSYYNNPHLQESHLPKWITVFDENNDIADHLDITIKDNFNLITYTESENG